MWLGNCGRSVSIGDHGGGDGGFAACVAEQEIDNITPGYYGLVDTHRLIAAALLCTDFWLW